MLLLVGLGNPGPAYRGHRHNVGIIAVDTIVRRHSFGSWRVRFHGRAAEGTVAGEKVLALEPTTFMNESGRAVAAAQRFYKLDKDDVIVIHDELDLRPGKVRVKRGGGEAGHNGLRSVSAHIGRDYRRLRIGIGHPGDKDLVTPYVLHDFSKAERSWLEPTLEAIAEAFPLLAVGDESGFLTKVALILNPPPRAKTDGAGRPGPGRDGGGAGGPDGTDRDGGV